MGALAKWVRELPEFNKLHLLEQKSRIPLVYLNTFVRHLAAREPSIHI